MKNQMPFFHIRLILAAFPLETSNAPCSARGNLKVSVGIGKRQVHTWPGFGTALRNPPAEIWKKSARALAMPVNKHRGKRGEPGGRDRRGMNARQFAREES